MEMQMFFFHYWVVNGYKFRSQTQSSKQAYDKIYEVATPVPVLLSQPGVSVI